MSLLASIASIFCSLSPGLAAPSIAIVPAGNVNKIVIISPAIESSALVDVNAQLAADTDDFADNAADPSQAAGDQPDKIALASEDDFLPADVFTQEDDFLPADVIADDDDFLPADVFTGAELEILPADIITDAELEFLPADVVADIDADQESAGLESAFLESEDDAAAGLPLAESSDESDPLSADEDAPQPPPSGLEESDVSDDGQSDGEAAA